MTNVMTNYVKVIDFVLHKFKTNNMFY